MIALFWRDIKLAFAAGNTIIVCLVFFLAVMTIIPFAVGPDPQILQKIGGGMIWINVLLSILLSLDHLFQNDKQDGSLDILIMGQDFTSLVFLVFSKAIAHWIGTVLPLIIITPFFALFLNIEPYNFLIIIITLILGTPAITFIGMAGAALSISLPRSNMLISIIILPLTIPIIIFGVSATNHIYYSSYNLMAPIFFLTAFSLIFSLIGSLTSAWTLKYFSQ